MNPKKRISPQAVLALQEALSVITWKKDDLRDIIKLCIENKGILVTIDWNKTKREAVKELIGRMSNSMNIYYDDIMSLFNEVSNMTQFPLLKFWDEDGSKTRAAQKAVENLRSLTKGYYQLTKEQEETRKRRIELERKIAKTKSLEADLNALQVEFNTLANNNNLQQRGYQLEKFLTKLFLLYDLDPKGSFKIYGEQIDGTFTFDGTDYLLEAKWKQQVNRGELASFCYKVDSKLKIAMGLMVSMEGLTKEAIAPEFKSIIIMDGADINAVIENRVSLPDLLYKKRRKANETGKIYVNIYELLKG